MSIDSQLCFDYIEKKGAVLLCENSAPFPGHNSISEGALTEFLQLYERPEILKKVEKESVRFAFPAPNAQSYKVVLSRSARGFVAYVRKFWGHNLPTLEAWQAPDKLKSLLNLKQGLILFAEKPHAHSGVLAAAFMQEYSKNKGLHIKNLSFVEDLPKVLPGSFITASQNSSSIPNFQNQADAYFWGEIASEQIPQVVASASTGGLVVASIGAHNLEGAVQLCQANLSTKETHLPTLLRQHLAAVVFCSELPAGNPEPYQWNINVFKTTS
ncbi:MAG: hypothetical protein GX801_03590 [Fibrobacter sp.]|nr:hypothetical protein [Fibrobacter sp.]